MNYSPLKTRFRAALLSLVGLAGLQAHELGPAHSHDAPAAKARPMIVETTGPIKAPPPLTSAEPVRASGQGFWKFTAVTTGVLPLPEVPRPFLRGAHGTLVVEAACDRVYWGLEKVGWVAFGNRLPQSWVVKGDPAFASGNLPGPTC